MMPCPHCNGELQNAQLSKCPDGDPHCLVAHYGFVCKSCGFEFDPIPTTSVKRTEPLVLGPDEPKQTPIGFVVKEKIGIGAVTRIRKT